MLIGLSARQVADRGENPRWLTMRTLERNLIDSGPADRDLPVRPRRLRRSSAVRRLVRESRLSADMLVYPMFVATGQGVSQPIESMPGQRRLSADLAEEAAASVFRAGVPAVLLFGSPRHKDDAATDAFADDGAVQQSNSGHQAVHPGDRHIFRRLRVRVHRPRSLRHRVQRRDRQRRLARCDGGRGFVSRAGGRGFRGSLRHDGRTRRRYSGGARREWIRTRGNHVVRGESTPALSTVPSGKPPTRRPSSVTVQRIRWTRPTCVRRCARSSSTFRRGPTS